MQRNHVKFNINRHCLCNKLEGLQKGLEMITETWSFKFVVLPTHTERSRHRQDRHRVTAVQAQAGQAMTRQAGTDKAGTEQKQAVQTGKRRQCRRHLTVCSCVCGILNLQKGAIILPDPSVSVSVHVGNLILKLQISAIIFRSLVPALCPPFLCPPCPCPPCTRPARLGF